MPKVARKFYAVAVGRGGPKIYTTWDEVRLPWDGIRDQHHTPDEAPVSPEVTILSQHDTSVSQEWAEEDHISLLPPSAVSLSPGQQQVLDIVKRGHSVFFTGSAGTGKSVLLREIIETLQERGGLGITASTGIAAVNIGGSTLHSWAGIGLGDEPSKRYAGKFLGQQKFRQVRDRWQNAKTLIIDESMYSIAREVRHSDSPFGGIQVCSLSLTFVDMLNAMRFGQMDAKAVMAFSALSRKVEYADGIEPTELFSTRQEVDNANASRLRQLNTESHTYNASEYPGVDSNGNTVNPMTMSRLLERLLVPKEIHLKNLVQGKLVNGSVGQVVRFSTPEDALKEHTDIASTARGEGQRLPQDRCVWPIVRFINGHETMIIPQEFTINNAYGGMEARRDQVPLILAWALSVHKSQGQTLERVKVDLRRTFEKGQGQYFRTMLGATLRLMNGIP
ncbi:DNA repair and recombination protein pif1 [Lyophyllum atratum]|nr:DNA repair and recombination protein pif1 [Lyophyllum atratum]